MKQAGIYSPYWDTLGGGEKYVAEVVRFLLDQEYRVTIFWPQKQIIDDLWERFGIDISGAQVDATSYGLFTQSGSFWHKWRLQKELDVMFWVSDGSLPWMYALKNIVHFQVPFVNKRSALPLTFLKQRTIDAVICNSLFTKQVIDEHYRTRSLVVYPPVRPIKPGRKENVILSVGRFDNLLHSKRQDMLIDAFSALETKDWKLILAGGVLHGNKHLTELKTMIGRKKIELVINPSWNQLIQLYAKASIYWHAAGFESDLSESPEKAEHFGISVVEAMSAGAVPVVFDGGGLKEIVSHTRDGFLWQDKAELINLTGRLIEDVDKRQAMAARARRRAKDFSEEVFYRELATIIR